MQKQLSQQATIAPQQRSIPRKIGDLVIRSISWSDFKGKKNPNVPYSAHIYWTIDYEIIPSKNKRSTVRVDVRILPKSWVVHDNRSQHLLMHEYGHYLIGCLCALAFQRKINELMRHPLTINTNDWIKSVFKQTLDQYLRVEKKYDEETNHRLNFSKQEEWEQFLIRSLQHYKQNNDKKQKPKEFKIHKFPKVKHLQRS